MATARPWGYAVLGASGTVTVGSLAARIYCTLTLQLEPELDLLQLAVCDALLGWTLWLAWRLCATRHAPRLDPALADIQATLTALAADIRRIDERVEIVAARSTRIASIIEEEAAVGVGETTGEIIRLPKRRTNGARIS